MTEDEHAKQFQDPALATETLVRTFLQEVRRQIADPDEAQVIQERIQARLTELEASHQDWIVDEPARYNLRMTAALLAAYQVLRERFSQEELLALLRAAFLEPFKDTMQQGAAQILDHVSDPFQTIVEISKTKEKYMYGDGFTFEIERDDDRAYLLNFKRCFYHNFFASNDAPELTPIFCDFDMPWISAIDTERHGFRFERPTTIGYGGTMCPFHFYRVEKKAAR